MTGCRCNNLEIRGRGRRVRRFPSRISLSALALIGGSFFFWAGPAPALSPPTELTPPEPPASGQTLPPPAPGSPTIQSEPLPQPTFEQPLPEPGAGQVPGQAPLGGTPIPAATMPTAATPQPQAIGADLGPNLWLGSDTSRLMGLIPRLPAPVSEPALRDLQVRLLTTAARPTGNGDPLLPFRAERLNAMGFSDAALALTQASAALPPTDPQGDPQGAVEQALSAGDGNGACARVDAETAKMTVPDAFWRKALIYCQLSRKQTDQAQIGLDLMREQSGKDPATTNFLNVAAVATGDAKPKSIKKIVTADPVMIALMQLAGLPAPAAASPATPRAVGAAASVVTARDGSQPLPNRITAAERAYGFGLIPIEELIALYGLAAPTAGDPVAGMAAADSPLSRAALYQAAASAQVPEARARLISAALQRGRLRGDYFTQAMLYAPYAQQISPSRNLAWFAPEAARVLLLTGRLDRGSFWLNTVEGLPSNPDLARTAPGLRLLARLVGASGTAVSNTDLVAAWRQANGGSEAQAAQLYAIFAGLGQKIGGWNGIAPITPNGSIASEINAAAVSGRRGETVLLSLVALGGDKLASADPASLSASLGGLSSVGLQAEARQIAVQAAVLIGL